MTRLPTLLPCLIVLAFSACATPAEPAVPVSMEIPRGERAAFLATPFPSDLLRRPGGGLNLEAFPNPYGSESFEELIALFQSAPGFSSSAPLYFHVEGGVAPGSLPADAAASMASDSTLFLVELGAPERRLPVELGLYRDGTSSLPAGTVAVAPVLGAVVHGPAALVVTTEARHSSGARLGPSDDMKALLRCDGGVDVDGVDCRPYASALDTLQLELDDVALLQLFTPAASTVELARAVNALREAEPPLSSDWVRSTELHEQYVLYEGVVELAQLQAGTPPYARLDGISGGFVLDDNGAPQVQRYEAVSVMLTVPQGESPADGWPVAVYGHGTGGDLRTGIGDSARFEAHQLARAGYAMMTTSEPLHLGREGYIAGNEEVATFNFLNPLAGRDNWRQSAYEKAQLVSLAMSLELSTAVTGVAPVRFDPGRVAYFGHSQGGVVGSLVVGVETRLTGAFLSGAGAGFAAALLEKTEPVNIAQLFRSLIGMPDEEVLDRFHPALGLLQLWIEPAETLNYGRAWRTGDHDQPLHLVMSAGLLDDFTPKSTQAALAGAFGLPLIEPVAERWPVLDLLGIDSVPGPAQGNLQDARGRALTAGVLQYPDEGHFAVFTDPAAQEAYRRFFESLRQGTPVAQGER